MLKYILSPSGLIAVCFMIGFLAKSHQTTRRLANIFIPAGAILYILLSIGPMAYILLKPLEFKYDAYQADVVQRETRHIVVMAGYAADEPYYPVSSKANSASLFRLVEAFHLWKEESSRGIIITGYKEVPLIMKEVLIEMGVPEACVVVENRSNNSFESARNVKSMLHGKFFLLVTSAGHMPRSMGVFQKMGMNPIPAPTDYQVGKNPLRAGWLPTVGHLYYSELAIHEYIGLLWYKFKGMI